MKKGFIAIVCLLMLFFAWAVPSSAATTTTVTIKIDDPVVGKLPDRKANSSSKALVLMKKVTWYENGEKMPGAFKKGKDYTVSIQYEQATTNDESKKMGDTIKATVNGKTAVVKNKTSKGFTVEYTWENIKSTTTPVVTKDKSIKNIVVTGLSVPVPGKSPDTSYTTDYDEAFVAKYALWSAKGWYDGDPVAYDKEYTVTLRCALESGNGYSFDSSIFEGEKATVNGKPATVKKGLNNTYVDIEYTFPKTAEDPKKENPSNIDRVSITLVGPQLNRQVEVPKVPSGAHYKIESYEWSEGGDYYGNYKADTAYTLTVTVVTVSNAYGFTADRFDKVGKTNSAYLSVAGRAPTITYFSPHKLAFTYKFQKTDGYVGEKPATLVDSPFTFAGGTGTVEDPYLIATAHQLNAMRKGMDKHYKLIADIDLSTWGNWIPIGSNEAYGGLRSGGVNQAYMNTETFTGSLDGNGHVISGMTIKIDAEEIYMEEQANTRYYGLIMNMDGYISAADKDYDNKKGREYGVYNQIRPHFIKDLGMINYTIDIHHGKIEKMYDVYAGAILGTCNEVGIYNCYTKGGKIRIDLSDANSNDFVRTRVGSLVGDASHTNFRNCYNLSDVEVIADPAYEGGLDLQGAGICGTNTASWFASCFNKGNVTMPQFTNWDNDMVTSGTAAGITAICYPPIFPELYHNGEELNAYMWNCYNTGTVTGQFASGIMVYGSSDFYIDNCYNIGQINGRPTNGDITLVNATYPIFADALCVEIVKYGTEYVRRTYTNGTAVSGDKWVYSNNLGRMVLKDIPEDNLKVHVPVFGSGEPGKTQFTDVVPGSFYEDAVKWALDNGVTSGMSETSFAPTDFCTRGQVVTFLWRASGKPEPSSTNNPFVDVKPEDYFYKPVLWAVEKGITQGMSATEFGPSSTCTSAQVITFLHRSKGTPKPSKTTGIASKYRGQYFFEALAWGDENGLIANVSTEFAPNNSSPRADIVTYLYRCTK